MKKVHVNNPNSMINNEAILFSHKRSLIRCDLNFRLSESSFDLSVYFGHWSRQDHLRLFKSALSQNGNFVKFT